MGTSNIVFFDIETQLIADDVGGWDHIDKMKVAIAVTYSTQTDMFHVFRESQLDKMVDQFRLASCVIGYNIKRFDYTVLQPYTDYPLHTLPTFDMLEKIEAKLGYRLKLDNLAKVTIGMPKFTDGLTAVRWWKEGRTHDVIKYCKKDVEITKRLYEYACDKGRLFFMDRNGAQRFVTTDDWEVTL